MYDESAGAEAKVQVEIRDDQAWLWLNRPEAHNALSPDLVADAQAALDALVVERPRVLVLAGRGPSFCAGADIKWMRESVALPEEANRQDALAVGRLLWTIAEFPAPVVARVHGMVAGGGNGVVAAADIAVADQDTRFVFSEVKLGIVPAVIAPFVVRKIGAGRAAALWMTAERFDGRAAERYGLVHRAVDEFTLDNAVADVITALREAGPVAVLEARALAWRVTQDPGEDLPGELAALNARLRRSDEGREGLQAFLDRRKPGWTE